MSASEYPTTDAGEIKALLHRVLEGQEQQNARLGSHAAAINEIGANLGWLVQNTQGLFQMFASPQFVSQMSNMVMGGMQNAGPNAPDATGTSEGADG